MKFFFGWGLNHTDKEEFQKSYFSDLQEIQEI